MSSIISNSSGDQQETCALDGTSYLALSPTWVGIGLFGLDTADSRNLNLNDPISDLVYTNDIQKEGLDAAYQAETGGAWSNEGSTIRPDSILSPSHKTLHGADQSQLSPTTEQDASAIHNSPMTYNTMLDILDKLSPVKVTAQGSSREDNAKSQLTNLIVETYRK